MAVQCLELEFQRKLHDSGVVSLRNESAEVGITQVFSFVGQVLHDSMIEHVKELRAELQPAFLGDAEVLVHGEIHVPEAAIAKCVAACTAGTARSRKAKQSALLFGDQNTSPLRVCRWPD